MFKPTLPFPAFALTVTLALCGGAAQAQSAPQPSGADDKGCQASTAGSNGSASDANMDGTYSACSLANGFIGFGARTNDGSSPVSDFNLGISDQVLRRPQSGERDHRLANLLAQQGGTGTEGGLRTGRAGGEYRFGTRDFVAVQESPVIDDLDGYRGAARSMRSAGNEYAALVTSSDSGISTPAGNGGVGGGGAGGGVDAGRNTSGGGGTAIVPPVTPAVPEPGTWAMLMAGLALLAFAVRRQA